MNELLLKINELCEAFAMNAESQMIKGNKTAGARARKISIELEKQLKEFRKLSIEDSKN